MDCKNAREYADKATTVLAAETVSLGGNVADQPRLQGIEERMAVLAVSGQMPLMLRGRGVGSLCCHAPGAEACVGDAILPQRPGARMQRRNKLASSDGPQEPRIRKRRALQPQRQQSVRR